MNLFLKFCKGHIGIIILCAHLIGNLVIWISVYHFGNSYSGTPFHWTIIVFLLGVTIILLIPSDKKKGCLYGKTTEQVNDFFQSLAEFALTDKVFFEEQYLDLLPDEQKRFYQWVKEDKQNKIAMLQALNIIEKLQKKHKS